MEIISRIFLTHIAETFLKNWRVETMLVIITFLTTYYFMNKKIEKLECKICEMLIDFKRVRNLMAKLLEILQEMQEENDIELMKSLARDAVKKYRN